MKESDGARDDSAEAAEIDVTKNGVGDLEDAGETTAAEMIGGAPDTRPVGQDSMANVKVSDTPEPTHDDKS